MRPDVGREREWEGQMTDEAEPSTLRSLVGKALGWGVLGALALFGLSIYLLFSGKVPPPWLFVVYLYYASAMMIVLHAIFFLAQAAVESKGKRLSKNIPKYLDYAYTLIICVGLFQIIGSIPRVAEYVVWLQGDETYLANKIKAIAAGYLADECINKSTKREERGFFRVPVDYFYDAQYCGKLKRVVEAPDVREYVEKHVLPDDAFVNHTIEDASDAEFVRVKQSPITDIVARFRLVRSYSEARGAAASPLSGPVAWVTLLLLPLAISVRLVKTSLELYGNLG
jgi:hypothetical protein